MLRSTARTFIYLQYSKDNGKTVDALVLDQDREKFILEMMIAEKREKSWQLASESLIITQKPITQKPAPKKTTQPPKRHLTDALIGGRDTATSDSIPRIPNTPAKPKKISFKVA